MFLMNTVSIPSPFRFNPWKHHLYWVQDCLQHVRNNPKDSKLRNEIIENINSINSNLIDIYTGHITTEQLIKGICDELKKFEIKDRNGFSSWIGRWGFKLITLSDSSVWVLREGTDNELYIHIHPARNSPNIVRIHGNSWKTVVATQIFYPHMVDVDILVINEVRVKHLNLSPIKNIYDSQRLLKAMKLVSCQYVIVG